VFEFAQCPERGGFVADGGNGAGQVRDQAAGQRGAGRGAIRDIAAASRVAVDALGAEDFEPVATAADGRAIKAISEIAAKARRSIGTKYPTLRETKPGSAAPLARARRSEERSEPRPCAGCRN